MKTNLIIGAGQLGSRHLQGLLRLTTTQTIYVFDHSPLSLEVAETRAKEIPNHHNIIYTKNWQEIPSSLDLVIVATGANVREAVLIQLLNSCRVRYLVLEKILFQDLNSYTRISELLKNTDTKTWVNHPRRLYSVYEQIKIKLKSDVTDIVFCVTGSNWGLGCNALHFIDLFCYLANSKVLSLNGDLIDERLQESKRIGFVEFTGSITGRLENGSTFIITSFIGDPGPLTVTIATSISRWLVQEALTTQILYLGKDNLFNFEISSAEIPFQSNLTTNVAKSILNNGVCELPTYVDACDSHRPFIKLMLDKYVSLSGISTTNCPIT